MFDCRRPRVVPAVATSDPPPRRLRRDCSRGFGSRGLFYALAACLSSKEKESPPIPTVQTFCRPVLPLICLPPSPCGLRSAGPGIFSPYRDGEKGAFIDDFAHRQGCRTSAIAAAVLLLPVYGDKMPGPADRSPQGEGGRQMRSGAGRSIIVDLGTTRPPPRRRPARRARRGWRTASPVSAAVPPPAAPRSRPWRRRGRR